MESTLRDRTRESDQKIDVRSFSTGFPNEQDEQDSFTTYTEKIKIIQFWNLFAFLDKGRIPYSSVGSLNVKSLSVEIL